jgi:hypothetical protein
MSKKQDKLVLALDQMAALTAGMTDLFAPPGSAQGRYGAFLKDSAQGMIQAQAAANERRRQENKKKNKGIGALAGTVLGAALAIPTGGMSIPVGAAIGGGVGGAVDSAVMGDYGAAATGLASSLGTAGAMKSAVAPGVSAVAPGVSGISEAVPKSKLTLQGPNAMADQMTAPVEPKMAGGPLKLTDKSAGGGAVVPALAGATAGAGLITAYKNMQAKQQQRTAGVSPMAPMDIKGMFPAQQQEWGQSMGAAGLPITKAQSAALPRKTRRELRKSGVNVPSPGLTGWLQNIAREMQQQPPVYRDPYGVVHVQ